MYKSDDRVVGSWPASSSVQERAVRQLAARLLQDRATEFNLKVQPNTELKHYAIVWIDCSPNI